MNADADDVMHALESEHGETARMLESLSDTQWLLPTRCEGWSVADVVLHLAQTDELALASLRGALPEPVTELTGGPDTVSAVDEGAAAMVELQRGIEPDALLERWTTRTAELRDELAKSDPSRRVQWLAGLLSARTLATTRLAETWIHEGDIAAALGIEKKPTERLRHVARLAWRTLPYAFERAGRKMNGPVAFDLRGPEGGTWKFVPDEGVGPPATLIRGQGVELCLVAGRRLDPSSTALTGEGPDVDAVLSLVRTYA